MEWRVIKVAILAGLISSIASLIIRDVIHAPEPRERCAAARQTVIEETELIAEAGKFPSEKITNRWKALMGGCEP